MRLSSQFEYRFGYNTGKVNEVDRKMCQHDRRQRARLQVRYHEHGADNRGDQDGVQPETPMDEPESDRGNYHDRRRTLRELAEKCVHVTAKNEFFNYPHQKQPQRQVNPIPGRTPDDRHGANR